MKLSKTLGEVFKIILIPKTLLPAGSWPQKCKLQKEPFSRNQAVNEKVKTRDGSLSFLIFLEIHALPTHGHVQWGRPMANFSFKSSAIELTIQDIEEESNWTPRPISPCMLAATSHTNTRIIGSYTQVLGSIRLSLKIPSPSTSHVYCY